MKLRCATCESSPLYWLGVLAMMTGAMWAGATGHSFWPWPLLGLVGAVLAHLSPWRKRPSGSEEGTRG